MEKLHSAEKQVFTEPIGGQFPMSGILILGRFASKQAEVVKAQKVFNVFYCALRSLRRV